MEQLQAIATSIDNAVSDLTLAEVHGQAVAQASAQAGILAFQQQVLSELAGVRGFQEQVLVGVSLQVNALLQGAAGATPSYPVMHP